MAIQDRQFFELFPHFHKGDSGLGRELLAASNPFSCKAKTRLYYEGDACEQIVFILEGEIRVFKTGESSREITLYEIGPGDTCILNASCILSGNDYPADAISLSDCRLLMLPASVFRSLVDKYSDMRRYIFSLLSERMATIMTLIDEIVFRKLDDRLLDYLLEKSENGQLSTTHQTIANDLGSSREVISRLLKDFERQGRLSLSRNLIRIEEALTP